MRGFSYVVETDSGFAPNPFWGYCTLATCKPIIRRGAKVDDWIFGLGSASSQMRGRLIFAMKVEEVLSFKQYNDDARFQVKKPNLHGTHEQKCGDNIYYQDENGHWNQRDCFHCDEDITKDISGQNVLISQYFWYFGKKALLIPEEFKGMVKGGRGHMSNIPEGVLSGVINWLKDKWTPGVHGEPVDFNRISFGTRK